MGLLRIDLTASDEAARELINLIGSIDGIDRVEETADLMPHMDDDDSSSAGLVDDEGPGIHQIEIQARKDKLELVRDTAMNFARSRSVVVEFEEDE